MEAQVPAGKGKGERWGEGGGEKAGKEEVVGMVSVSRLGEEVCNSRYNGMENGAGLSSDS